MAADVVVDFTVAAADPCAAPATPIGAVQGSGARRSPVPGSAVTVEGVVVGDYEGAAPALRGFYVQDARRRRTRGTSDGIFVFNGNADGVALGDDVRVTGTASRSSRDQTQVQTARSRSRTCSTAAPRSSPRRRHAPGRALRLSRTARACSCACRRTLA